MKLNLASGPWVVPGWTAVDLDPQFKPDVRCDLTKFPYPFQDNSADFIFCSHMLEHFTYPQAKAFLAECLRILKPRGAIRISVPDVQDAITKLVTGEFASWYEKLIEKGEMVNKHPTQLMAFTKEFAYPGLEVEGKTLHKSMWDRITLSLFLREAGFKDVTITTFKGSRYEEFKAPGLDNRPEHSLFIEGEKP
jgi:ubiquinone/menaquinone biosynthesis C-methylase UbiE